jgi:hypothetical protein
MRAEGKDCMFRGWRRATVAALVTGVAIAGQLAGVGTAHASASPTISIAATTKLKPVSGDSLVVYHLSTYNSAKLHGTIANATTGEVAALYAQPFPYKKPPTRVASITLKAAKTAYSFTVTPSVVTHYAVRLFASSTTTAAVASSPAKTLYVTTDQSTNEPQKCSRPVCHETFRIDTYVPASALSVEMSKHLDAYIGINLGGASIPPEPKWLYLNAGNAKVTKSRRISAGEFENTLTFSFTVGSHSIYWLPDFCTRDAVGKDGLGLPGYHDCGASRIPSDQDYLG